MSKEKYPVSNLKKESICASCIFHQTLTSHSVHCMYIVATKQQRCCPIGLCDKYEYADKSTHKEFWDLVNRLDDNPDKPNALTLNYYKYYQMKKKK